MRKKLLSVSCILLGFTSFQVASTEATDYTPRHIHGWTVQVSEVLLNDDSELGERAIELLENKLFEARRVLPEQALKRLQKAPIWLDREHDPFPGGVYHPSADWLREHGHNPDMAGGVHIANATNFLNWTHDQPAMVIHELAHAFHHQVLGYGNEDIKQAYQNAVESQKYESVMRYNGEMQRAYALNNEQEYFAEASEAYFGVNDFYPFVRAELNHHDPDIFQLVERLWTNPPLRKTP